MPVALLVTVYLCLCLLPLGLSALRFAEPRGWMDELASGAGMVAFAMILAEFLWSGRFRIVSRRTGMDTTMRLHQLLARTALFLALAHPFLYRAPMAAPLPWDPTRRAVISFDWESLWSGIVAFLLLPSLIGLAIARRDGAARYETWRLLHGLGAAAIAVLVLDHALTAGRYAADPVIAAFWVGLSGAALASLGTVYFLRPALRSRKPWRLAGLERVAERTWDVTLAPVGHPGLCYEAGQFLWLNIGSSPFSLKEHPFSISSAPSAGRELRFLIKELGDFTETLGTLPIGTRAHIDGPYGHLTLGGRSHPGIVLLAGGVGLAPLIGILRELEATRDPRPRLLVYGNRTEAQIAHRGELDAMAQSGLTRVQYVLSAPGEGWTGRVGQIDRSTLDGLVTPQMRSWLVLVCGPAGMIDACERALHGLGVPGGNIVSERFEYD